MVDGVLLHLCNSLKWLSGMGMTVVSHIFMWFFLLFSLCHVFIIVLLKGFIGSRVCLKFSNFSFLVSFAVVYDPAASMARAFMHSRIHYVNALHGTTPSTDMNHKAAFRALTGKRSIAVH